VYPKITKAETKIHRVKHNRAE